MRWWCGAQVQGSSVQICPSMLMRKTGASLRARVCFLPLWIILLLWWRAHPCLILPDPLRLRWHPPPPHPPIAPSAATCCKGSEEAEAEGVRGERTLCVPAPSVNRTTFIFPNSQSYYIRHTNASCLQQLRNIIKRRTEFCSSPLFSRCRKASDSCEKLNSVSLVSFRRAASWAAPHFQ